MVCAISAFLDFCYLVRHAVINESTLAAIDKAIQVFHRERTIFVMTGVCDHMSLPHQHAMTHYHSLIEMFGAPNGICSSITESRHIKAVKEPWRRSNQYEALGQMLVTNQRLDKLAAVHQDFIERGMLCGPLLPEGVVATQEYEDSDQSDDDGDGTVDVPHSTFDVQLACQHGELLSWHVHKPGTDSLEFPSTITTLGRCSNRELLWIYRSHALHPAISL